MSRSKPPVDSFGPELMEALLKGALNSYWVELPYSVAVKLRQRLYQLRLAMMEHRHEKYTLVSRVQVSIEIKSTGQRIGGRVQALGEEPCLVEIGPSDTRFVEALKLAGVEPRGLDDPIPDPEPDTRTQPGLDAFFEDLKS